MQTYCILDSKSNLVKIGKSKHPSKRLKELSTGNGNNLKLIGCIDGDCERELHENFRHLHINGEWFINSIVITNLFHQ